MFSEESRFAATFRFCRSPFWLQPAADVQENAVNIYLVRLQGAGDVLLVVLEATLYARQYVTGMGYRSKGSHKPF